MSKTLYIIELPFLGYIKSTISVNESGQREVDWTGGLSPDQYLKERWDGVTPMKIVTEKTFFKLEEEYHHSRVTAPKEITEERFWDMLEVLPPCRWGQYGNFECFHVSERITGNLVSWFAKDKSTGKYYEFEDFANIDRSRLVNLQVSESDTFEA